MIRGRETNRSRLSITLFFMASAFLSLAACSNIGHVLGFGTGEGDDKDQDKKMEVIDRPDQNEYILVKNPKYLPSGGPGQSGYQPEYIWVKRKDAPFSVDAFIRGKKAMEADQKTEEKFASTKPPEAEKAPRPDDRFFVPPDQLKKSPPAQSQQQPAPQKVAKRPDPSTLLYPVYGYVVYVKGKQVYTDITEDSGAAAGNTVIIYREGEELKHPVTGAVLGRAEDEIGRARIVEVGEKTSRAEITEVKEGEEVHPKDKVKLLRAN